jgi:hypothetical protein
MLTKMTQSKSTKSRLLLCAAAMTALTAVGCASDDAGVEGEESMDEASDLALQAGGSTQSVPNPNGSYFASVTANGTGCPAGSWKTDISSDGQTFTTTFDRYVTEINERQTVAVKNCQLTIKLHSPNGLSYSVSQFYYQGYAFLEEGVKARQIAQYYFQGNPVAAEQIRADLVGPVDDTYLFEDKIRTIDTVVWSPCGVDRNLNVNTTLRLQNDSSNPGNGYINVSSVDGKTETKLVFRLNWRKCDAAGASAPAPSQPSRGGRGGRG